MSTALSRRTVSSESAKPGSSDKGGPLHELLADDVAAEQVVGDPPPGAPAPGDVPFWPLIGLATLGVSAIMLLGITLGMAASPNSTWIDGLGTAVFATIWGGPGFGLMFGGAWWTVRVHAAEAKASAQAA